MAQKDIFWMACDSTEQLRAEYGPFHTREEAEIEARKLGSDTCCATSTFWAPTKRSRKCAAFLSNCKMEARRSSPLARHLPHPLCQLRPGRVPRVRVAGRSLGRHPRVRAYPHKVRLFEHAAEKA